MQEVAEDGAEAPDAAERPELTQPLSNYLDLVRHGAVQGALLERPDIVLRLMVAHAIGGSALWKARSTSGDDALHLFLATERHRVEEAQRARH